MMTMENKYLPKIVEKRHEKSNKNFWKKVDTRDGNHETLFLILKGFGWKY